MFNRQFLVLLLILFGFTSLPSCKHKPDSISFEEKHNQCIHLGSGAYPNCMIGASLPRLDFKSIDGLHLTSENLDGNILVFNFWATHCKPCVAEIEGLNNLVRKYVEDKVKFIAVTYESPEEIKSFIDSNNFIFDHLSDPSGEIRKQLFKSNHGIPLTMVYDKGGILQKMIIGGRTDSEASNVVFEKLSTEIEKIL